MGRRRALTKSEIEEVCAAYLDGSSMGKIAIQYGVSEPTIRRKLIDNGITARKRELSATIQEEICRAYAAREMTQDQLARKYHVRPQTVSGILKCGGVEARHGAASHQATYRIREPSLREDMLRIRGTDVIQIWDEDEEEEEDGLPTSFD